MADLTGQVAVVTGASRGVGKGVAVGLARAGATVFATGRRIVQADLGRVCRPCGPVLSDHGLCYWAGV